MVRQLALSLLLCLTSVYAHAAGFSRAQDFRPATPEELAMKHVPGAEGAEAAILDWVRIDDDQTATTTEYYRIKVFTEEGKKHAQVELTYVPIFPISGKISDVSARTIRPDGTFVPFDGKLYDKVLFKIGRAALKAKTFTFADVQPGSILEYRYTSRRSNMLLLNTFWPVQRDIPIVHAKLSLQPYDSHGQFGSFFTYNGLPPGKLPVLNGKVFELELENMAAVRPEAFMPPDQQVRARVNFFYTDKRIVFEQFWPQQAGIFNTEIEKFLKSKNAKKEAEKLVAGIDDKKAVLEKLYAHVQGMRHLSFEDDKTAQEQRRDDAAEGSKNADEVLRKGAGYKNELNRTFVALARGAGFDAYALRVASRSESFFSDKLPDADQMSAEVALVTLDGKPLYLDPGTPRAPFGVISWEKTNVASIQATKDSKPVWGMVPAAEAAESVVRRRADLRVNDDLLEGTIEVTFTGQEALVRRLAGYTDDDAARRKAIEEEVKKWFPDGATLKLTKLAGHDNSDPAMTAAFEVSLPNAVSSAGSRTVIPLSIFAAKAPNPFAPATRTHQIYFPYATQEEDEVKLTLPEGATLATVPTPANIDAGAFKYKAKTAQQGNVVTFTRTSSVHGMLFDVSHYPALRNFFSAVVTADQQSLVLGGAK
jgi:hypothetical protein